MYSFYICLYHRLPFTFHCTPLLMLVSDCYPSIRLKQWNATFKNTVVGQRRVSVSLHHYTVQQAPSPKCEGNGESFVVIGGAMQRHYMTSSLALLIEFGQTYYLCVVNRAY